MTELSKNAYEIAKSRYLWENEDKWEQLADRICRENARVEEDSDKYYDKFMSIIEPMLFIPAGRILRNLGKLKPSTSNCNFLPLEDNIESIFETLKYYGIISAYGGGNGINFSALRPKGAKLVTRGGESTGMLSFLDLFDYAGHKIETGGNRRAAGIALCNISHPEVLDFIDAKVQHDKLKQFNISVIIDDTFLNAVENSETWDLKFSGKVYNTMNAKDLWDKILHNMIDHAEPGFINWNKLSKNNTFYFSPIAGVNPCITGDTMVAVADGREHISIKQLAEEGKDVPVFSLNKRGNIEVRIMRNPRVTGYKNKILKIKLDDGSSFRCTENHKILTKDGVYKRADELKSGDRLNHTVKFIASLNEIFAGSNSRSSDYKWINNGIKQQNIAEHRLIASFFNNHKLKTGEVVHHKDFNSLNNTPSNLNIMRREDHTRLHSEHMKGDNNLVIRFPEKNWLIKQDWSGTSNGRYLGIEPEQVFSEGVKFAKTLKRRPTKKEWVRYCKDNSLPYSTYSFGKYKTSSIFLDAITTKANVLNISDFDLREYKKFKKIASESDLDVRYNYDTNTVEVYKTCEYCGKEFTVSWGNREQSFCSRSCGNLGRETNDYSEMSRDYFLSEQEETRNKQINVFTNLKSRLGRNPFKKEWEDECRLLNIPFRLRGKNYNLDSNPYVFRTFRELTETALSNNFKVVSIEEDGYEDVYNGTVDDFHNFYILASESKTHSGKKKYNYINNLQCGELPLEEFGVCNLGALVLPNFIANKNMDWQKLARAIKYAVRFLDNIIDIAYYPISQQDTVVKNARRIGLGTMGLADYLFLKKIRYGSEKAIQEISNLYKFIRDEAYKASVELAIEKGAFPKYDRVQYSNASFIRKLPAKLRMYIKDNTIRNSTLLTAAPTGSTSLIANVNGGIEPLPFKGYRRVDGVGERIYVHPLVKEEINESWFVDSYDLIPEEHLDTQVAVQKYIDGGVSKTILLPEDATEDRLSRLLMEYIRDLKGVTVYRDKSREEQVYYRMNSKEIEEAFKNGDVDFYLSEEDVKCARGTCEI